MIAGLVVAISLSFAQNPNKKTKTPEQRATNRSEALAQKLTLSADQKQSVYNLILERATKVDAIRAKYASGGDRKAMRQELKPILVDFDAKLKAILTPEQVAKWEQLKAEQKAKRQAKRTERKDAKKNAKVKVASPAQSDDDDANDDGIDD